MSVKITLGICGSSAIWKVCPLIEELQQRLNEVEICVVMTEMATKFIQPLMFQTMTKNSVSVEVYDSEEKGKINHIALAQESDLLLIVPITANTIAKMRQGISDNMLLNVVNATPKSTPKILCPAMNHVMWNGDSVQENLAVLKKRGFIEVEPDIGTLSSGDTAIGVLAHIKKIADIVVNELNNQ